MLRCSHRRDRANRSTRKEGNAASRQLVVSSIREEVRAWCVRMNYKKTDDGYRASWWYYKKKEGTLQRRLVVSSTREGANGLNTKRP
jgi:hypothetical protein